MGAVQEVAIHLGGARRREFRRFLVVSALLHLVGFTLLAAFPTLPVVAPTGAIAVNLVAAPGPPRATPAPPAPRPPKPAPVVLPQEPALPEPGPRAAPEEEVPPEPEPPPVERDYRDVLAELRAELGEEVPEEPPEPVRTATSGGGARGPGRPLSPQVAAWMRDARIHIRRSWVVPPGFRTQSLATVIEVELDAAGVVRGEPRVRRRSGNPWYDDGVVRSIQKASPLPAPPEPGSWTFVMVSDELL